MRTTDLWLVHEAAQQVLSSGLPTEHQLIWLKSLKRGLPAIMTCQDIPPRELIEAELTGHINTLIENAEKVSPEATAGPVTGEPGRSPEGNQGSTEAKAGVPAAGKEEGAKAHRPDTRGKGQNGRRVP